MVFGIGETKKRKRHRGERGKARSGKERMELEKARHLELLRKSGDPRYERYMNQQLGLTDQKSELEQLVDSLGYLQKVGLAQDPSKVGEGDWKKELAGAVGLIGRAFITGQAPEAVQDALGGAAPQNTQAQLPAPQNAAPAEENRPMSIVVAMKARAIKATVQKMLDKKGPVEAAHLLIAARASNQVVEDLVQGFSMLEDAQMEDFLKAICRQHPEYAPTIAWLVERQDWFWEAVYEVRRQLGPVSGAQVVTENSNVSSNAMGL